MADIFLFPVFSAVGSIVTAFVLIIANIFAFRVVLWKKRGKTAPYVGEPKSKEELFALLDIMEDSGYFLLTDIMPVFYWFSFSALIWLICTGIDRLTNGEIGSFISVIIPVALFIIIGIFTIISMKKDDKKDRDKSYYLNMSDEKCIFEARQLRSKYLNYREYFLSKDRKRWYITLVILLIIGSIAAYSKIRYNYFEIQIEDNVYTFRDYKYEKLDDGSLKILGYSGSAKDLAIPAFIKDQPISTIGEKAFEKNKDLQTVLIPKGVTMIEYGAFSDCEKLKNVEMADSIVELDHMVFYSCDELIKVKLSNSLKEIPDATFERCENLQSCKIPVSVQRIGDNAFERCHKLKKLEISEGVKEIGNYAFEYCDHLQNIMIPETLETIGQNIFKDCEALKEIKSSGSHSPMKMVDGVIFSADGKRMISYPGNQNVKNYVVPEGTEIIDANMFEYCEYLETIELPGSIRQIGEYCFAYCDSITKIVFPEGLTILANDMCFSCDSLREVVLPESLQEIGDCAFYGCEQLEVINSPASLERRGYHAFEGCDRLKKLP